MTSQGGAGDAWWTRPAPTGPAAAPEAEDAAPAPAAHPAADWSRTATPQAPRRPAPPPRPTRTSPPPRATRPTRPPVRGPGNPAPFGDQRGLTAAGATLMVLVLSGLGAAVDIATGDELRTVFAVALIVAAALAACTVHPEDLVASVVLVPLVFAAVAGAAGIIEGTAFDSLSNMIQKAAYIMVKAAPALMIATVTAGVIAGARTYAGRRRGRPVPQRRIV